MENWIPVSSTGMTS
ncbi:MAG: hypothetical protein ACEY3H_05285 [Wolbachia sp.]|uniref:Uncharacterized protein n=2 Tax=Wolbachia TaxID=953 RepID=A0A7G5CED2_WOLPI|nr:hypothetical protein [Wolbachia pipientis]QMV47566.1 hypothetical protein HC356_04570 [Wolbachia pipientis]